MPKKVLIVEDDPFIVEILAHKFVNKGWEVVALRTGEASLEELETNMFDIILLDILLPGINGYEVLEKLKLSEKAKNIPVIVLSNYSQENEVKKSISLGAVEHIVKADIILDEVVERASKVAQ